MLARRSPARGIHSRRIPELRERESIESLMPALWFGLRNFRASQKLLVSQYHYRHRRQGKVAAAYFSPEIT